MTVVYNRPFLTTVRQTFWGLVLTFGADWQAVGGRSAWQPAQSEFDSAADSVVKHYSPRRSRAPPPCFTVRRVGPPECFR